MIDFPRGAEPGEVSAEVLFNLGIIAGPLTSIIGLAVLFFYFGHRLDRTRIAEIQFELADRRARSAKRK